MQDDKNGDDLEYASDMVKAKDVSLLTTIRIDVEKWKMYFFFFNKINIPCYLKHVKNNEIFCRGHGWPKILKFEFWNK